LDQEIKQENSKASTRRPSRWIQVLVALVVIVAATCFGMYYRFANSTTFATGVEIGGVMVEGLSQTQAEAALDKGLQEFNATRVKFSKDAYNYESSIGDLVQLQSSGEIVKKVWEQERTRGWQAKAANLAGGKTIGYPVQVAIDPERKASLVAEWESQWGRVAQDASLDVDTHNGLVVIPGTLGYKVNVEKSFSGLPQTVSRTEPLSLPVVVEAVQPAVTAEMLKNMGELSSFATYFNTGEVNRSHNLRKATASINKKVLLPNEIFSFNETVGQRTMEMGYLDAMVIVGNKFEPGLGGGICQVSSTLYNASLLAGLEIVERHNHNLAVAYVKVGRDATVNYGVQDFRFKNNTDRPVFIRAITSGGQLLINIYGNTEYKQRIEIATIIDKTLDYTTVTELDQTLAPGQELVNNNGQPGYVVRSFRKFLDKDGKVLRSEQLDTDTYRPLNRLVLKGPELAPGTLQAPGVGGDGGPTDTTQPRTPSLDQPGEDEDDERPLNRPTIQP